MVGGPLSSATEIFFRIVLIPATFQTAPERLFRGHSHRPQPKQIALQTLDADQAESGPATSKITLAFGPERNRPHESRSYHLPLEFSGPE